MIMNVKSLPKYYPRTSKGVVSLISLQEELQRVKTELRQLQLRQRKMHLQLMKQKKKEPELAYDDRTLVEKRLKELSDQHEMRIHLSDRSR
jgi:hypothetical protein